MDALSRVACYFPAQSLTSFWILSNLIINNAECQSQTQGLMIALIVIFCIFVLLCSFTDTYTASNNMKYIVLLMPCYGPVCFSLPSDFDKDRVYEHYYLKIRDYVRAFISMTAFLLIVIFISPISICLFPSGTNDGTARLDPAIIRTIPVVVAVATALFMMCLGVPRQCLGYQNVDETCPALERQMGDNPIYTHGKGPGGSHGGYPGPSPSIPEGDEDDYNEPPPAGYNNLGNGPAGYKDMPPPYNNTQSYNGVNSSRSTYRDDRSRSSGIAAQHGRASRSPEPGIRESGMSSRSMEQHRGGPHDN